MSAAPPIRLLYLSHVIAQLVTSSLECEGKWVRKEIRSLRSELSSIQSSYKAGIRFCEVLNGHSLAPPDVSSRSSFADSTASPQTVSLVWQIRLPKLPLPIFLVPQTQQLLHSTKATATDEPIANSRYHGWTSSTCFTQDRDDLLCRLPVQSPSRRNFGQVGNATFPCARTS